MENIKKIDLQFRKIINLTVDVVFDQLYNENLCKSNEQVDGFFSEFIITA